MFFRSRNANFIGWSGHPQSFHFLVSIGFKLEHQTVRRQQEEAENAPVGLNRAQSLGRVTCSSVGRISSQFNPLTPVKTVTNGAIVIHTQRLKSDPGGNLLS